LAGFNPIKVGGENPDELQGKKETSEKKRMIKNKQHLSIRETERYGPQTNAVMWEGGENKGSDSIWEGERATIHLVEKEKTMGGYSGQRKVLVVGVKRGEKKRLDSTGWSGEEIEGRGKKTKRGSA